MVQAQCAPCASRCRSPHYSKKFNDTRFILYFSLSIRGVLLTPPRKKAQIEPYLWPGINTVLFGEVRHAVVCVLFRRC